MTTPNNYKCPRCSAEGKLKLMRPLYPDTRYDAVKCDNCGVEWRVYYHVSDQVVELVHVPGAPQNDVSVPENATEQPRVKRKVTKVSTSTDGSKEENAD